MTAKLAVPLISSVLGTFCILVLAICRHRKIWRWRVTAAGPSTQNPAAQEADEKGASQAFGCEADSEWDARSRGLLGVNYPEPAHFSSLSTRIAVPVCHYNPGNSASQRNTVSVHRSTTYRLNFKVAERESSARGTNGEETRTYTIDAPPRYSVVVERQMGEERSQL